HCSSANGGDGSEAIKAERNIELQALTDDLHKFTPEQDQTVTLTYDTNSEGVKSGVVVVTFNVPDKLNALTEVIGHVFEKRMRQIR
ncbi:hypothetical protein SARC_17127, partial [Sphaeroforma arctica JP610]